MHLALEGHTALVTGSTGGIGTAIADRLAHEGCAVIVHGRRRERAEAVADRIRADGGECRILLGDLTDAAQTGDIARAAVDQRVDVLVNNTGPFTEHDWDTVQPDDWEAAFRGNVAPTTALTQALLPGMRDGGWGRVITVGSRAVVTPLPNMVEYSAAKAAVANLTVSLAQHLTGTGITVNCVSPGVMSTPSLQEMFQARPEFAGADWSDIEPEITSTYAPNPSGRLGRPADIADAVAFLASPLAGYINGVNLRVDGGITGTL